MRRLMMVMGTCGLIAGAGLASVSDHSPAQAYPSTQRIELQVTGRAGVPLDASAVVMNVTATNAEAPGFVVVWPCGEPFPEASNLNFSAGQDIPNLVISRIGAGGKVCLEASANTDLIADVAGHFPAGSDYTPTASPVRILDTRSTGPVTPDAPLVVPVAGRANVPNDALAVVMNVTATGGADPGYVTVYPCTPTPPEASNLNFVAGQDIPNLVIARINGNGDVCMYGSTSVNLIADVAGYFPAGSDYAPSESPVRILDTRSGVGAPRQVVPAGGTVALQVGGNGGVPGDASAVVMNVTVIAGLNPGYVTVFPCGQPVPEASNLNYSAGQAIPNLVIARLGAEGRVCLFTSAQVNLVADVGGYFPAGSDYTPAATPVRILDTRSIPAPTPPPTTPAPAPQPPPTSPPTTVSPPPPPQQPPNPGNTKNCSDFATYQEAKAWYDYYFPWYGDVAKLDGDGNGIPCESLPGAP